MRRSANLCAVVAAIILVPTFAAGFAHASTTWTVRQDGTGNFTTINAAKAAATTGDIIEVGPGIYTEEIDFSYAVTLRSTDGPTATVLDGENVRRILIFRAGTGSVVDGFTVKRGNFASSAGALRVQLGARATVNNCVFESNHSAADGGAVICRDSGSRIGFTNCTFDQNTALTNGGAVDIITGGICTFDHCVFKENSANASGGIACLSGSCTITNSLLVRNHGSIPFQIQESTAILTNNTFYDNPVQVAQSTFTITRNTFVHNHNGAGLAGAFGNTRTCNLYWDNFVNIPGDNLHATEIDIDPVLCDPANDDFSISAHSPAAPANNTCGQLLGAYGPACDIPAPPPTTWQPVLATLEDVPGDQGNAVRITWRRSYFDRYNAFYVVPLYRIYRQQDSPLLLNSGSGANRARRGAARLDGWDLVASVPANGAFEYEQNVPTLCNKPYGGAPCFSTFMVVALAENAIGDSVTTISSKPGSGYSEDNIPPGPPGDFTVVPAQPGANLTWTAPNAPDLAGFRVYRAEGTDPVLGPATLTHSTTANEWADPDGDNLSHYLLTAVDLNGNESSPASPVTATPVATTAPARFALRQNVPNPFNPATRIVYDVPREGGDVHIDIFDVTGRRVRALLGEHRPAGTWTIEWDGRSDAGARVASGIYFYRLRAKGFEKTLRMTLLE
jgi:hypothetical protein